MWYFIIGFISCFVFVILDCRRYDAKKHREKDIEEYCNYLKDEIENFENKISCIKDRLRNLKSPDPSFDAEQFIKNKYEVLSTNIEKVIRKETVLPYKFRDNKKVCDLYYKYKVLELTYSNMDMAYSNIFKQYLQIKKI